MKGVSFRGRHQEVRSASENWLRARAWRILPAVLAVLLLSSLFGTSGVASAIQRESGLPSMEHDDRAVEVTIGTMTVTIVSSVDGYVIDYRQNSAAARVNIIDDSDGVRYSINDRPWQEVSLGSFLDPRTPTPQLTEQQSPNPMLDPGFHWGRTKFWWDGVRFVKGYPTAYAHPDRSFYHVLPKSDWRYWGVELMHHQLGTDQVGALASAGPYAVGAVIGGVVGFIVGGAAGAVLGAIAGVLVGAILAYYFSITFVDEAGTIWWWINKSLFSALRSIPWWLWFCGRCIDAYILSHIDFLRVGTLTANNDLRIPGP